MNSNGNGQPFLKAKVGTRIVCHINKCCYMFCPNPFEMIQVIQQIKLNTVIALTPFVQLCQILIKYYRNKPKNSLIELKPKPLEML